MKKDLEIKTKELRKQGYSVKELQEMIGVSRGTISRWIQNVPLSTKAQKRLADRSTAARIKSALTIREQTRQKNIIADDFAEKVLSSAKINADIRAIICSMIYFCEGAKSYGVNFINSDPSLIQLFLSFFRRAFEIKEEKLRVLMHIHDYHDLAKQKRYWSKVTGIPTSQFQKTFIKSSDHKYRKEGYQGCIMVRYYDMSIARKLAAIAKSFMERYK